MSRPLRMGLIALVVVVVATLGGYYANHKSTTTTTTSTTTSTSTTISSTTTVATTTTTTVASLTTCRGSEFTGTNLGSQGAAGTGYDIMTLTKVTTGSCVVDGYPLLTLQEAKGVVESVTHMSSSTSFPTSPANQVASAHTVNLGDKVSIEIRYSDIPVASETCPSIVQVNVNFVANDTSVPVTFPYPISPCVLEGVGVSAFYPS